MLTDLLGAARDFGRLRDITAILIRYGFSDIVHRLGMAPGKDRRCTGRKRNTQMQTPQRIRGAMEDLGPTFVKLGQLMSTRVDLFPPEWINEFEQLQDHVPAEDFETLRPQVETDLGGPPETVFAEFDTEALAAASIAQVHRATLTDGTPVIVKIRRPGIEETV